VRTLTSTSSYSFVFLPLSIGCGQQDVNLIVLFLLLHQAAVRICVPTLPHKQAGYQMTFSANWICLASVVVEVSKPAAPVGAPVESKMSVLSGVIGGAKFA
jgi:hypothetical protein